MFPHPVPPPLNLSILDFHLLRRLMICVDWFDPGTRAGGPIRSCVNLIKLLHHDVEVSVLTGDRDLGAEECYARVRCGTWNNWNGLASCWYATRRQHATGAFLNAYRRVKPQTIYLNGMFSFFGAIVPLLSIPLLNQRLLNANTRIVIAPRGMLKESALSMKRWKKTPWLTLLRLSGIARRVVFHATSEQEAEEVRHWFGTTATVHVVPNIPCLPVDTLTLSQKQCGKLRLSFAGRVHPVKNLLYLLRLLQTLTCECSLNVIGPIEDVTYDQECREVITKLPGNVTVKFSGAVSNEQALQLVADSDFMILPTVGENFGHAIFEALSQGIPVLISDQTYWRDLEQDRAGWDLNLSRPDQFRAVLERMGQMSSQEYQLWQTGAHRRAIRFFESHDLKSAYLDLLLGQAGRRPSSCGC